MKHRATAGAIGIARLACQHIGTIARVYKVAPRQPLYEDPHRYQSNDSDHSYKQILHHD